MGGGNNDFDVNAACRLKSYRKVLTRRQYQTLKGQILSGDPFGAMRGLEKILHQKRKVKDCERQNSCN